MISQISLSIRICTQKLIGVTQLRNMKVTLFIDQNDRHIHIEYFMIYLC